MSQSISNRILVTPSTYSKKHYLYVQEVGSLECIEPHISSRKNLNSFLFMIVTSGSGKLTYGQNHFSLKTGDCIWIDCKKSYSHESSISDPWTLSWVHFNGENATIYYRNYIEQENEIVFHPYHFSTFKEILDSLYQAQQEPNAVTELISNKYLTDIITLCFTENKQYQEEENSTNNKLMQIREYLNLHYAEKISLDQLSDAFFISKYHLSREYKKVFGSTIGTDLMRKRVSHAKLLLRFTKEPIETIALNSGFQDAGYFIKVFRKAENMTPLEYRKHW